MAAFASVSQVCITRPTGDLKRLLGFYRDALGLPVLFSFEGEGGSAGAMIGLPGAVCHLELLQVPGEPLQEPNRYNLLILHMGSQATVDSVAERVRLAGFEAIAPANPYWTDKAILFQDPDGWPLALSTGAGLAV